MSADSASGGASGPIHDDAACPTASHASRALTKTAATTTRITAIESSRRLKPLQPASIRSVRTNDAPIPCRCPIAKNIQNANTRAQPSGCISRAPEKNADTSEPNRMPIWACMSL